MFNKSLSSGVFLDKWKISKLIQIHKSGCKQDICNYRIISKISCIPKIFEKIVSDKLMPLINKSLWESQHGFRRGWSTITNLVLFSNYKNFTDFAKAFDIVNHSTLLAKLNILDIKSIIFGSHSTYNQYIMINSTLSYKCIVSLGVPQGCHLSPLIFLLA